MESPNAQVGVATASRQFFQQLGGAIGIAVLSVLFVNTISQSLEHDLAPLRASLPPEARAMLDPAKLRNGHGGEPGGRAVFARRGAAGPGTSEVRAVDPAAVEIRHRIGEAQKRAFTLAVTRVYRAGLPIVVLAFVLMLFVPPAPLRRTNRESTPAGPPATTA